MRFINLELGTGAAIAANRIPSGDTKIMMTPEAKARATVPRQTGYPRCSPSARWPYRGTASEKAEPELTDGSGEDACAESKEIIEKAVQTEQTEDRSSGWRKLMNPIRQVRTDSLATCCFHEKLATITAPQDLFAPILDAKRQSGPILCWGAYQTGLCWLASSKFIVLDKLILVLFTSRSPVACPCEGESVRLGSSDRAPRSCCPDDHTKMLNQLATSCSS